MKKSRYSSFIIHHSDNKGQSLIEILVALAVGTILIIAAVSVIAPALRANTQADKVQVSSALGKELLENVRVFGEADWHNISNLATGSANKYFLVSAQSPFIAATGTEGISADGIASGTVGYWKLDESTGTTAYDFSGNGNNGSWNGSGNHFTGGQIGGAGQVASTTNDYVSVGNPSVLNISGSMTVSAWVNPTALFNEIGFVTKYGSGYEWALRTAGGSSRPRFTVDNPNGTDWNVDSTSTLSIGVWQLLTGVYDQSASKLYIYLNGTLTGMASSPASVSAGTNLVLIGAQNRAGFNYTGSIDDVRIYNRALSAAEVRTIYLSNIYTRYFYMDTVGRDAGDVLLSSGGTNDPSTEKATVVYGWPGGPTSSFSMYLTRFRNNVFDQTDWSGGSGQDGPATTTNNKFSTSTQINYSTTTGSIMIQLP